LPPALAETRAMRSAPARSVRKHVAHTNLRAIGELDPRRENLGLLRPELRRPNRTQLQHPPLLGRRQYARRRHTLEQMIRKLREADRLLGEGREVAAVAKRLEVSEQTLQRWRL